MALQVWLPLNGNLENQGLSNVTVINKGATVDDNGKIGKCYYFNGINYLIGNGPLSYSTQNFSIAFWVKYNNNSSYYCIYSQRTAIGEGITVWKINNHIRFDDGSNEWETPYKLTANIWTHVTVTRTSSEKKLYINGELKSTTTSGSLKSVSSKFIIGMSSKNNDTNVPTSYGLYGRLNDVRIYDHCLSPKEVKEISKGLVLHYKLDNYIGENLIDNSSNITTGWGKYTSVSTLTYENGKVKAVASSSGMPRIFNKTVLPYASVQEYYTIYVDYICQSDISIHGKSSNSVTELNESGSQSIGTIKKLYQINSENNHKIIVFSWLRPAATDTIKSSWWMISFGVNTTLYINQVKVEKGLNRQIVWTPYNIEYSTVHDCSGYQHHGNVATDLIVDNNTPRYNYCIKNAIEYPCKTITSIDFPESSGLTICCWVNLTAWGHQTSGLWATSNLSTDPTDYNTTACNHRDNGFDMRGTNGTTYRLACSATDIPVNAWKYVAITHDGANAKLYINGVLIRTKEIPSPLASFKYVYLGYSKAGNVIRKCQGSWSDFRIYATALSDEDIKELYDTSAIIDNQNNLHTRELIEDNMDYVEISKKGIVKTDSLTEGNNGIIFNSDNIECNQLIEI